MRRRQQDRDVAPVEGEKLKSAQEEAKVKRQVSRARLAPLEQELAVQIFLTNEDLQASDQREVERVQHERLRILKEILSRLASAE